MPNGPTADVKRRGVASKRDAVAVDLGTDPSDRLAAGQVAASRSLDYLAGFLRVIRVPRADIRAMIESAPAGTHEAMETPLPASLNLDAASWPAAGDRLGALPDAVRRLYAGPASPDPLEAIGEGRARLVEEAVASYQAGRLASAIMVVVAQIDGIAADVPPTPGAALPFLIDDPRDLDAPGASLDAATLAAHPGALASVAQLMRTSRPDTNLTTGLHRHGIMHGRDLGFDTPQNAARVFALLAELVAWATPIADARRLPIGSRR